MRIHVHDYSGHPFQVQLSRELAARGYEVVHGYSTQYVTGHGRLNSEPHDPASFSVQGFTCERPLIKYSPIGRTRFERAYARSVTTWLESQQFDLVVACNIPLFALGILRRHFERTDQQWVLWHQDIYSLAVGNEAARKLPAPAASFARRAVERVERRQVRDAAAVVAITEAMVEQYSAWGVERDGVHVIPNWAPLDDILPGDRDNVWAREHCLPASGVRIVYAGTLGRKHNPLLLLDMLDAARDEGLAATLVVASEGDGANQLAAAADGRDDVMLVGYQPMESFSDLLASADVVVAILEPDAARYSVPSKVLSYFCAGRPVIALVPDGNPAAEDVLAAGGYVGAPTRAGAQASASWLRDAVDGAQLPGIGRRARDLAEMRFDVQVIGDRFEAIFAQARGRGCAEPAASVRS